MAQVSVTNMFCWPGMMCQKAERNQKALGKGHVFRDFAFSCSPPCCCPASLRHTRCVRCLSHCLTATGGALGTESHRGRSGQSQRLKRRLWEKAGERKLYGEGGFAWDGEYEWLQESGPEQHVAEQARQGCRSVGKEKVRAFSIAEAVGTQGLNATPRNLEFSYRAQSSRWHPSRAGLATS